MDKNKAKHFFLCRHMLMYKGNSCMMIPLSVCHYLAMIVVYCGIVHSDLLWKLFMPVSLVYYNNWNRKVTTAISRTRISAEENN